MHHRHRISPAVASRSIISSCKDTEQNNASIPNTIRYRFATLSSFTSISLSPPTISFALRTPSRWASLLKERAVDSQTLTTQSQGMLFHLHILSHYQHTLSSLFASPTAQDTPAIRDLVHRAYLQSNVPLSSSPKSYDSSTFLSPQRTKEDISALHLDWVDDLPLIRGCLAVLICRAVRCIHIADHEVWFAEVVRAIDHDNDTIHDSNIAKSTFTASTSTGSVQQTYSGRRKSLLYLNRRYITINDND